MHITSHYIACCVVLSDPTKSLASGITTLWEPKLMAQVGWVHEVVCTCISVCFCSLSSGGVSIFADPFMDTTVVRIWVGWCVVPSKVLDDLCCLPSVAAASGWAEVDTLPLVSGGCCHVIEVGGLCGLWDSRWKLSFKITRSLWNYSRCAFFAYCWQLNFLLGDLYQVSLVKCSFDSCESSITLNSLIRVTRIQNAGAWSEMWALFRSVTSI
jgi:hypothetical protein